MQESDRQFEDAGPPGDADALAKIIRSAGKRPEPRAEDYERVLHASLNAWRRSVRRRRLFQSLAVAATVAILGIGVFVLTETEKTAPGPAATIVLVRGRVEAEDASGTRVELGTGRATINAGTRFRTLGGAGAAFTREDGTSVRLDRATEIAFTAPARIELARGTIYVDSGVGHGTPTEVATRFGTVRDLGTQFEVRTSADGLRIRVREGVVELYESPRAPRVMSTGHEQLTVAVSGEIRRSAVAPDSSDWEWATSLAAAPDIGGHTVYEIVTWIARESGKDLRFADAAAERRAREALLSGKSGDLTPLELLDVVIGTVQGLGYELRPGVIIVRAL